jgi:uncharacterized membrane protein YphA (DoxX/SURF4 family)
VALRVLLFLQHGLSKFFGFPSPSAPRPELVFAGPGPLSLDALLWRSGPDGRILERA